MSARERGGRLKLSIFIAHSEASIEDSASFVPEAIDRLLLFERNYPHSFGKSMGLRQANRLFLNSANTGATGRLIPPPEFLSSLLLCLRLWFEIHSPRSIP